MTFSNLCNEIFWKSTTDYHVTDSVDAVSYTHLDVYKRQILERVFVRKPSRFPSKRL